MLLNIQLSCHLLFLSLGSVVPQGRYEMVLFLFVFTYPGMKILGESKRPDANSLEQDIEVTDILICTIIAVFVDIFVAA